ncbi:MAG: tetratricopeptide repeat protein [Gemmatimonadota bacterium]|nr:tetratricopeptide repeat protein [Gemmatimonadota bacterium]
MSTATPGVRTGLRDVTGWTERQAFWEAVILLLAIGLYAHTVGFGWVYDDEIEVVANVHIRSLASIPEMFTTTAWAGAGVETYLYRPLPLVTYAVNHALFGLAPWSYHLVNVLLHALASVLVFRLARSWRLSITVAGIGAALFAVHPIHVEVVASVAGRKDLLAAALTLAMVLSHRSAVTRGGAWRVALPILAYGGALLSKEVGAVGILLVLAQDWLVPADEHGRSPERGRRLLGLYLAYVLVLLAYLLVRLAVAGGIGVPTHFIDNPLVAIPLGQRVGTALVVVAYGLQLLVAPFPLSPDYSHDAIPLVQSLTDWRLIAAVAVMAFVVSGLAQRRVRATILPLAVLWYALALLPSSNLPFTVGTVFGERLLYLPSVAFCVAVAWALVTSSGRYRPASIVLTAAIVVALAVQAVRYSAAWTDNLTLFQWATASVPRSSKAHHKLGESYYRAGSLGPAVASLRRALQIAPENEFARETITTVAQYIGELYGSDGLSGAAPPEADAEILYVLGQMSRQRGQMDDARRFWEAAVERDTTHAESLADLGVLYLSRSDTARAVEYLDRATRRQPDLASPWFNLARLHLARGDRRQARTALQRFVDLADRNYASEVAWARSALTALHRP